MDKDGVISKEEMLKVVESIYSLSGGILKLAEDERTPEKRVEKVIDVHYLAITLTND